MTCRQVIEFLDDYLSGSLPRGQRWRFMLHLAICRHCRRYLASYAATVKAAQRLDQAAGPLPEVPPDLVRAILASKRAAEQASTEKPRWGLDENRPAVG